MSGWMIVFGLVIIACTVQILAGGTGCRPGEARQRAVRHSSGGRGRITEDGCHDDLVAARGQYARLFEIQAANYR